MYWSLTNAADRIMERSARRRHSASPPRQQNRRNRPLLAMAVAALMLVSGLVMVPAVPAQAAIHNVFPADHDGFPTDRFFTNEALFATFTVDTEGGRICVVGADVTDPASRTCESPAWGSSNTVLGMGTFLGFPLEPSAELVPGEWRLLADHKPAGQDEYEGLSLSEVFRVLPCQGACETSVSEQHFQAWKERARGLQSGHHGVCAASTVADTVNQIKSLSSAVSAGRGMYALAGGGLAAMMLGAAWGVVDYMMGDLNTEERAMALLVRTSCDVAQMYQDIVDDPPDFNYDTIAEPEFVDLPLTGDDLWDTYLDTLMRVEAYGKASRIAYERFQGAQIDEDPAAASMQAKAASDFTFALVHQLRALEPLQAAVGALPWLAGPVATQDELDEAQAHRARIHTDGYTPEERQALLDAGSDLGLTEDLLDQITGDYGQPALEDVDLDYSLGDQLSDTTALIPDLIVDYDMFARSLAGIAAEYDKQVPGPVPNRAPVSSFTASATSGQAPLTVEFTSTAVDPDGDDLFLTWDIAGARKVENEHTISHTFTTPGNYGVSLVADDGQEWHQAIMWISVYPPGSSGEDNQAPIARFTPTLVDEQGPVTQTFTSLSFDPDGDELTHTWYFGDGVQLTGEQVTRTFDAGFIYSVLLVVSDGHLTGQASGEVTSQHPGGPPVDNEPPVASFDATPLSGTAPLEVEFTSTSTDPDGDALTHTWHFGNGESAEGESVSHTYLYPGTYNVTLVVSDGQVSRVATEQIVVTPEPGELQASFGVSSGYDAAKLVNGARIFTVSSEQNTTTRAGSNVVAPNANWWDTATGQTTDQSIVLHLAGDGRDLLDRLDITGSGTNTSPRTISLDLSQDVTPLGAYTTVLDQVEMAQQADAQTFTFDAQTARFARVRLHDNWGGNTISTRDISLPSVDRSGGIVSLPEGIAAQVSDVSSSLGNADDPNNVLNGTSSSWRSASGQNADQFIQVELGGEVTHQVNTLALRGHTTTSSVRDFELLLSPDGNTWTSVLSDELPAGTDLHTFTFDPEQARYAELRMTSNHGGTVMALRELQVITADGLNVADGRGGGAALVSYSSRNSSASFEPVNAIGADVSAWRSAPGEHTDQHLTVLLRDGQVETIDRVMLRSTLNNSRPRTVEVWVSETGSDATDFTRVASRMLLNVSNEQWLTFAPVAARFVQVRMIDSFSENYISLQDLRVFATSRGAAAEVPFVDLSSPGDHEIVSWAWDFGHLGGTSTDQHAVHTFPGPGTYPVALTVTDADGGQRTHTSQYTVPPMPQISLSTDSTTVDEGAAVSFRAEHMSGTAIIEWSWDLDYTQPTTTGPTSAGRFPDQGDYQVTVRGLTADGLWTSPQTLQMTVLNVPPTLTMRDMSAYARDAFSPGNTVNVSDVAADMPLLCTVDWGDGDTTTVEECTATSLRAVEHTYDRAGDFNVTITADDRNGGVSTATATATMLHRPVLAQITEVTPAGQDLMVTARVVDTRTGAPLGGVPLHLSGDDGTPVTANTDSGGFLTLPLPGGTATLDVAFDGNDLHAPATLHRDVNAPAADIVFILDESTSMTGYTQQVVQNVQTIVGGMGAHLDYRIGVISLRGNQPVLEDHATILLPASNDLEAYVQALGQLTRYGGSVNGHAAVVRAASADMHLREAAATCFVLVSDAGANEINSPSSPDTTRAEALAAAAEHGAAVFSIMSGHQSALDEYGPGDGLAGSTGGAWWPIAQFNAQTAAEVLDSLVTGCVQIARTPDISVTKSSGSDIVEPGAEVEYTLTVRNEAALDVAGVELVDTLPEGTDVVAISDDGQQIAGQVSWPPFALAAGAELTRTLRIRMPNENLTPGDHPVINTAQVALPDGYEPESDEDNNTSEYTVTLRVDEDYVPEVHDVGIDKHLDLPDGVAAGDEFEYSLTVTNYGDTPAANLVVRDLIPDRFEVTGVDAPGWTNPAGADVVSARTDGLPGSVLTLEREDLGEDDTSTVVITVRALPLSQPPVVTDTGEVDADLPAVVAAPDDEVSWVACVVASRDQNSANDCAESTVALRDIVAQVTVRLADGVTFLIVSAQTTAAIADEPLTLQWVPLDDGVPTDAAPGQVSVDGLARGQNHVLPWPGVSFDDSGTVVDWPGWRVLTEDDDAGDGTLRHPVTGEPMSAVEQEELVRGDLLLDLGEPDFPWRFLSEVLVSAGAESRFIVEYREDVPLPDPVEVEDPPVDTEDPVDPEDPPVNPEDPVDPETPVTTEGLLDLDEVAEDDDPEAASTNLTSGTASGDLVATGSGIDTRMLVVVSLLFLLGGLALLQRKVALTARTMD